MKVVFLTKPNKNATVQRRSSTCMAVMLVMRSFYYAYAENWPILVISFEDALLSL